MASPELFLDDIWRTHAEQDATSATGMVPRRRHQRGCEKMFKNTYKTRGWFLQRGVLRKEFFNEHMEMKFEELSVCCVVPQTCSNLMGHFLSTGLNCENVLCSHVGITRIVCTF